jgi:hypothetical protein
MDWGLEGWIGDWRDGLGVGGMDWRDGLGGWIGGMVRRDGSKRWIVGMVRGLFRGMDK